MAKVDHAKRSGNFGKGRNYGQAVARHGSHDLPTVQPYPQEQGRHMPVGDFHAGRGGVALLALFEQGRGLL